MKFSTKLSSYWRKLYCIYFMVYNERKEKNKTNILFYESNILQEIFSQIFEEKLEIEDEKH